MNPPLPRTFTFSKLDRHKACTASAVLDEWPEESGPQADRGNAAHRFLQHVPDVGADAALSEVPAEFRAWCARINLDDLPLAREHRREIALALNVRTGEARVLDVKDRAYPDMGPEWIMGTLDVAGVIGDGKTAYVADYKTGRNAKARMQLVAGVLAWTAVSGLDAGNAEVLHIDDAGDVWRHTQMALDGFDLAGELAALREMVEAWHRMRREGVVPVPTPGDHCKYCASWKLCPAKVALIRHASEANGVDRLEQLARNQLQIANVGRALQMADQLKEAAGRIYSEAYGLAAMDGPIQVDEHQALGYHPQATPDELVGSVVHDVVAAEFGVEVANVAVEMSATKASLKRALDKARESGAIPKGQGAATERRVMAAVSAAGGLISHEPKQRMGMFKRPRDQQSRTG
jgi:hypothetical protein